MHNRREGSIARRERVGLGRQNHPDFFTQYSHDAQAILGNLLDRYDEHGTTQFEIPAVLKVPPI